MTEYFLISVIVATYNNPKFLQATLRALNLQTDKYFEVLIADDGSKEDTKLLIEEESKQLSLNIKHIWHPDTGFRLAEIRNKAAKQANGELLLFLDGDCLPLPDWIERNRALAERGWLIQGQRVLITEKGLKPIMEKVEEFTPQTFSLANLKKWYDLGFLNRFWPCLRLPMGAIRKVSPKKWKKIKGCNFAVWKSDYFSVKGSDESFTGWGHEDADLIVRLVNSGIKIKRGAFASTVLHLWHPFASREKANKNWAIVLDRAKNKTIYPTKGL